MLLVLVAVMCLAAPLVAHAQYLGGNQQPGYTINTPGQPPVFVNPNFGGGYTVVRPGEPPTFINPNFGGGYTINKPGEPPTFVNPNFHRTEPLPPAFGGDDNDD
jgi:hypothetical protein